MSNVDVPRNLNERRPRRGQWLVFFLLLGVLGAVAVIVPIVYNLGLQLKPEGVARARTLWGEKGPRDYDLELMRREDRQENTDEYRVKVRHGQVTSGVGKRVGLILVDEAVGLALGPMMCEQPPDDRS